MSSEQLFEYIEEIGQQCQEAQPIELCVSNTIRRLKNLIREECSPTKTTIDSPSLFSLFHEPQTKPLLTNVSKSLFVQTVNEMIDEMKTLHESIAAYSIAHIHSNEIILTCGSSTTTESFFLQAAKKRQFQVIVVESGSLLQGHHLAIKLAQAGIETTLIPDSAVCAVMSRVNKVVLGTHLVLANGGLVALAGACNIAVSAKHYAIPVVVLAGIYKLTPRYPYDLDAFHFMQSPARILPYSENVGIDIYDPMYDYVAPELVSLFITNEGVYAPSYMYRLLMESYHDLDNS
ncbi:Translation initiation factor eIF-2B subunit beta [Coelomomyces lativittatus]|nr:Translation initiation factor eIF-2B subunit beta [Coelomomyces lativittatus]